MKKKIIIIIIIIVIGGGSVAYFTLGKKETTEYTTAKVERGGIKQTVSETGTVKASSEIDLNFLNSGRVAKVFVKIGSKVKSGQSLAELDYSNLSIKQDEAQASLEVAQANLAKLLAGASAEEIAVSQASANQAKAAYDAAVKDLEKVNATAAENISQAEKTLSDLTLKTESDITSHEQAVTVALISLNNTKSTYQRAINNKEDSSLTTIENKLIVADTALDTINTILIDDEVENILSIENLTYLGDTINNHNQAEELLTTANNNLTVAKQDKTNTNINQALDDALAVLNKTFVALNKCFSALENTITSADFTQTELDAYKTNVSTDLTSVGAAISSVQTADHDLADAILDYEINVSNSEENLANKQAVLGDAIIAAENALATARLSGEQQITTAQSKVDSTLKTWEVAKAQLEQTKAPARIQDITLQQAQVRQVWAAVDSVKNQIDNSMIKAPIDGTITKVEYEIGEQTVVNTPVISMLAQNHYEIEVLISEADIAKIKLNDPTEITLDAFGDDLKFSGKIYFIEPAETEVQDVIYYKVMINFNSNNLSNVKSGMTANLIITTAQKSNVLIMPSRAIVERNGAGKIVRLLVNEQVNEVPIQVGLRGDEGMIEVLSGVKEGDEVVTFVKENK